MGAGAARSAPVCPSPPMVSLSGTIWGASWAVALSCPSQCGHQFVNLVPQFHSASIGSVIMADLALTLSLASSFLLSTLQAAIINWE